MVSRSAKPARVGPPGWRIWDHVSPIDMPKSSVMRLDSSPEISHSEAGGTSPVFDQLTVGSDNSSATHGSSITSVAGKKRGPTKQCAKAPDSGSEADKRPIASAHAYAGKRDMANFLSIEEAGVDAARAIAAGPARRSLLIHLHHAAVVHHHGAAGWRRSSAGRGRADGGDRKVDFDRSRLLESQRRFNRFAGL